MSATSPQYLVHVKRIGHEGAVFITHPLNGREATEDRSADAEVLCEGRSVDAGPPCPGGCSRGARLCLFLSP